MTDFFIKRPVFATVVSLMIVIMGVLAYRNLGVNEYPTVSIPTLSVSAPYPNASAEVVESDLTPLLEENLADVEGLENIQSYASTGLARVVLTFRPGVSMDRALAQVRDRVGRARTRWPKDAKEPQIDQQGGDSNAIMWLSVTSTQHQFAELSHFARLYIKNQLQTVQGISSIMVEGPPYEMTIKMDRLKMFAHRVSANEIISALELRRASFPAGRYHSDVPMTLKFPLEEAEDFENVVVKSSGGSLVHLKDVATAELSYDQRKIARINSRTAVFLGIVKTSEGNPLQISESVRNLVPILSQTLPAGVKLQIEFDGATFIRASLNGIRTSIFEAALFVLLVIFFFLRDVRSTIIPLITIPVSLIGALIFVMIFGFTINTISLLALVLAVGLVVDDAIVVLENIHRHLELGLSPLEAAKKGSREIAFAIIAMTLTLASVYAPIAFIPGVIGDLFIEFALTLAGAVIVSGIVALTLSPMMCSRMLRAERKELLPRVDIWISALNRGYHRLLEGLLRRPLIVFGAAALIIAGAAFLLVRIPSELAPKEDRGFIGAFIEPLPGKSVTELLPYAVKVEQVFQKHSEVSKTLMFNPGGDALIVAAPLKDWSERKRHSVDVTNEVREQLKSIPAVNAFAWNWDTGLPGIELGGRGASLEVAVRTTGSYEELSETLDRLQKSCQKDGVLTDIYHDMHMDFPGLRAKIDEKKMAMLQIDARELAKALETSFDKSSSLEFLKDGIRYDVSFATQGSSDDLSEVFVKNAKGTLIPLSAVVELEPVALPTELKHTRQLRSANFGALLAEGKSLNQGISYIEKKMAEILPSHYSYELTGVAKRQVESSNLMVFLFAMALVFIFCVLSIQFESFVDPFIILLTVPLATGGALFFMWMLNQSLNIFTQIGLITLVGLITKHGILIVDFANKRLATGLSVFDSVLEAASQRLRPVLMTTGAMMFGSVPLMIATGAGSEARRAIGTVLVGGLLFGTVLTLFVIPVFYLFVKSKLRRSAR